ncbi:MAG TPA: NYN domain-containing protein [Terriglobia bacterium]|nr:NYN domain-containing protein [Terriglobia bacterium]
MPEERLKLAVFIDFDNIQIGVKETLAKDFDVSLILESLKERGEVVAKVAYGDWARAGDHSRQMTQHAIQMVQRNVTPRGDKNGADINLALDALEMAFTRHHINAFAIVGGDSDFMALVEKLKQFDKQVFVIGGRAFTSNILQKNCTEFIAYENLLKAEGGRSRGSRREASARALETRALSEALPNIQRALKILEDRGVAPQLGLLKSTLLQLDSTFSERDYGAGSFLEFMQKVQRAGLARLRRTDRGFLVEPAEGESETKTPADVEGTPEPESPETEASTAAETPEAPSPEAPNPAALEILKQALAAAFEQNPGRALYMRQVRQRLRAVDPSFDERRYGYRGTLDLLHSAQREGLLKLLRDHKGVWRVHVAPTAPPAASTASEAESGEFAESANTSEAGEPAPSVDLTVIAEVPPQADGSQPEEAVLPGGSSRGAAEIDGESPASQSKPRKPRASKTPGKSPRRKPARRKSTAHDETS